MTEEKFIGHVDAQRVINGECSPEDIYAEQEKEEALQYNPQIDKQVVKKVIEKHAFHYKDMLVTNVEAVLKELGIE